MAHILSGGEDPIVQSTSQELQPGDVGTHNDPSVTLSTMNAEEDDMGDMIATMLADDGTTTEPVKTEVGVTEGPQVELTASEVVAKFQESRPGVKANVEKLCHHLETSGRPYAGRKAHALREQIAEIGKLTRKLGAQERKRKRGPTEKAPERPDYFAIAVRIQQESEGLEDAPGSPVAEVQQAFEDQEFTVPSTPQAGTAREEGSDFEEPPTKKRKQRKHMNAQQQADALSKLEAKIREINSAAMQPQSQHTVFQPAWVPLSPPKNASNPCSPEKKVAGGQRVIVDDADHEKDPDDEFAVDDPLESKSSRLEASDLTAVSEDAGGEAEVPESVALQAQDIAVVSRLALAAKYLSSISTIATSVGQDMQTFGLTFCGRKCWEDRYRYYEQDDLAQSEEDKVQWAKAILIDLVETVELFDDAAADEIDRFAQLI